MPDKYKPPYTFSKHIGAACTKQFRTFPDLAKKLKMDVTELMRQCNDKVSPSKALVKCLARELDIDESYLNRLAEEVRKDLGCGCNQSSATYGYFAVADSRRSGRSTARKRTRC
jgi:hypothetical protein